MGTEPVGQLKSHSLAPSLKIDYREVYLRCRAAYLLGEPAGARVHLEAMQSNELSRWNGHNFSITALHSVSMDFRLLPETSERRGDSGAVIRRLRLLAPAVIGIP